MKRYFLIVLTICLIVSFNLWASGKQEEQQATLEELTEPVTIEIWYSLGAKYSAPLEKIIKDFNQSQSLITVKGVYQGGYATTQEKLLAAYIAGNPPVLSQLEQSLAGAFVANDALVPLENFIKLDKEFDLNDYMKEMLQGAEFSGKLYGLPINVSTPVLYINRDLFRAKGLNPDKYPTTWEEAYEISKKLSDPAKPIYGIRVYNSGWIIHSYFKQFGGRLFNEDNTKVLFNSKEVKDAILFWKKMVDEKVAVYQGGKDGSAMDAASQIGMVMRSTGSIQWFKDHVKFDFGVAPFTLGKVKAVSLGGGNVYMLKKTTPEQQRAAWEFLKYLTSKDSQIYWALNTGYMVSRKSAFNSPEVQGIFKKDPRYRVTYDQLPYAFPRPKVAQWPEIEDLIQDAMTKIIVQGASIDILDQAAKKAQELLE